MHTSSNGMSSGLKSSTSKVSGPGENANGGSSLALNSTYAWLIIGISMCVYGDNTCTLAFASSAVSRTAPS